MILGSECMDMFSVWDGGKVWRITVEECVRPVPVLDATPKVQVIDIHMLQASGDGFNFANAIVQSACFIGFGGEPPTFLYVAEEARAKFIVELSCVFKLRSLQPLSLELPLPTLIQFTRVWEALHVTGELSGMITDGHEEVDEFSVDVVVNFDLAWRFVQQNRRGSTEHFHIPGVLRY